MNKTKANRKEDKPLLDLIKNLVNYSQHEDKTVLTNTHLVNILHKELDVDIWSAHSLEVDVYTSIIKKFLKQWPRWDTVEKAVKKAKTDPNIDIEENLNEEYEDLKKYLKEMILLSKDITEANVAKVIQHTKDKQEEPTTNVVLEVSCTRSQLNKLFFTQPHPEKGGTIFNIDQGASKISVNVLKLEELLYWPNLSFHATIGPFEFVRINKVHLEHTLINKKLPYTSKPTLMKNNGVYTKTTNRSLHGSGIDKNEAIQFYKKLITMLPQQALHRVFIKNMLYTIIKDLTYGPETIDQGNDYMYFPTKYPYIRYLRSDVNCANKGESSDSINYNNYLLHLEEILKPSVMFKLKLNTGNTSNDDVIKCLTNSTDPWIKVECVECDVKFDGMYNISTLKDHVLHHHGDEPDVQCTECKKEFPMSLMTFNCWTHECAPKDEKK